MIKSAITLLIALVSVLAISLVTSQSFAASHKPTARKPVYESPRPVMHHTSTKSPWDFTLGLELNNPGTGFGGLAAYRVVDGLIPSSSQNDLVVEGGLSYISFSSSYTLFGVASTASYSLIEIPIQARWDFYALDNKLIFGPRAGFNYLSAYTTNGFASISGINIAIGGDAIYYFTDNFGARVDLSIGGFTSILIGVNYTP